MLGTDLIFTPSVPNHRNDERRNIAVTILLPQTNENRRNPEQNLKITPILEAKQIMTFVIFPLKNMLIMLAVLLLLIVQKLCLFSQLYAKNYASTIDKGLLVTLSKLKENILLLIQSVRQVISSFWLLLRVPDANEAHC